MATSHSTIVESMMYYEQLNDRGVRTQGILLRANRTDFARRTTSVSVIPKRFPVLMKYVRGIDWKAPERKDADAAAAKKTTDQ